MQLGRLLLYVGFAWLAGRGLPAQNESRQAVRKAGEVAVEKASLNFAGAGRLDFEIGTLFVPETRSEPNSRIIGVGFARFRSDAASASPPVFMLPGGPGESYLSKLTDDDSRAGLLKRIQRCRQFADVILVDQRGFSERGEVLKFRHRKSAEPLDQPADLARSTAAFRELAQAAVLHFGKKGVDLRGYTVKECADDVDDLRRALGYDTIALMGGSFGSQWSFAVMRRHPDGVARALLTGVEPLDCAFDMPSHVLAAMQRMWREAEQDKRLEPYLPPGGLSAAAQAVLQRLERKQITVSVKRISVTLGPDDFRRALLAHSATAPAFVLSLYHEQYEEWALFTYQARRSRVTDLPVLAPLIDTSLGATPQRRRLLEQDPATAFLGRWNFDRHLATADTWPSPDVGDAFRTEVECRIPVVFVHGDWDTQTPVENTLQIAPFYRKGHVLLVERGGHGALNQLDQHSPKTVDALFRFLKSAETEGLPTRVRVPLPRFSVPDFPAPRQSSATH